MARLLICVLSLGLVVAFLSCKTDGLGIGQGTSPIGGAMHMDGGYPLAGQSAGGFSLQGDGTIAVGGRGGSSSYTSFSFYGDGRAPLGGQGGSSGSVPVGGRGGSSSFTMQGDGVVPPVGGRGGSSSFTMQGDGVVPPVGGRGGTSSYSSYTIHYDGSMYPVGGRGGSSSYTSYTMRGDGTFPVGGRGGGGGIQGDGIGPVGGVGGSGGIGGSSSRGGQAGGGASGGSLGTTLNGSKALNALTPAEATQLCIDSYGTLESVISRATACKWKGLVYTLTTSFPSEDIMRQNCTNQETDCLQSSPGSAACEGIPSTCTATVAQYSACVSDQAAASNQSVSRLPSCATLMRVDSAAVWDAMTADPPASCVLLNNKCPALSPPGPFYY